jgi:hypothetical protein
MRLVPEYKRVYQGGHHDVWCNGEVHAYINEGGKLGDDIKTMDIVNPKWIGLCNCDKYKPKQR